MGLTIKAKGLEHKNSYDCGYITFHHFRVELAKTYNKEFGELYERWINNGFAGSVPLTKNEFDKMNELSNDDLNIFLIHSDCEGKLTSTECGKIYNVIKDLKMNMEGHNYVTMNYYNMLEQWKNMFYHCWKKRVNMYFE